MVNWYETPTSLARDIRTNSLQNSTGWLIDASTLQAQVISAVAEGTAQVAAVLRVGSSDSSSTTNSFGDQQLQVIASLFAHACWLPAYCSTDSTL